MYTFTIRIDDSYITQFLEYLRKIPPEKKELIEYGPDTGYDKNDDFLTILKNGPSISKTEAKKWMNDIENGYKNWTIEEF